MTLRVLVVASETPDQQQSRRERSGQASHETFAGTLRRLDPDLAIEHVCCVTEDWRTGDASTPGGLRGFGAILFAGSPIQMHEENQATRSAAEFMRVAFSSGVPSFGSCAGLQIATVAAGGSTKPRERGMEVAFARSIVATDAGLDHPMLRGRPLAWDAPAMHASVVDRRPDGMTVLARTVDTPVEAAAIRSGGGVHWGVQYHPELTLGEIADAVRGAADAMIEQGMARDGAAVDRYAGILQTLSEDPGRTDLAWQIGVDDEVTDEGNRTREVRNFLDHAREAAA